MRCVIIPNEVRDAINSALDREIAKCPDAEKDREVLYAQLLNYFDEHGELPEFSIAKGKVSA